MFLFHMARRLHRMCSLPLLGLLAILLLAGCPTPKDPYDPAACQPACAAGYSCYRGLCRPADAASSLVYDIGITGDALTFDAIPVPEAGASAWVKNIFTDLDPELLSKGDSELTKEGIKLLQKWETGADNLLKNHGFESGDLSGWTDNSSKGAAVSAKRYHSGNFSVGGEDGGHEIYQDVDLSAYGAYIDRGQARTLCSMWMMSEKESATVAANKIQLVISFHFPGSAHLDSYNSGEVLPSTWTQYKDTRIPVPGIRMVRLWHKGFHTSGTTALCYGDDAVVQILLNKYSSKSSVIYSRTFEKPVNWGVLSWSGILSAGTAIGCQVRTSLNGSGNWGAWSPVTTNNQDLSGLLGVTDGHRTIEVKFDLAGNGVNTPVLTSFLLLYSLSS